MEIKNNLFLNNTNGGSGYYDSSNVTIFELDTLRYDHNWSEHPFYKDVYSTATTSIFCPSDTTTNIIGSTPGFVSPTLTNSVTESALPPANFSLLASSPCINMGDISGITPDSLDYARNARIYGSYIDIGACEYSPVAGALYTSAGPIAENNLITYPNPASGTLYVFTSEAKGAISLQDVSGKTILEQRVFAPQTPINIQPLPAGTYFVVWHHGNGGNTIQKVIKE